MRLGCTRWLAAVTLLPGLTAWADLPLNETRSTLEKWVETRQLVSRTRSDWQSDKEMLQQTADLLERELKGIEEQFSKLGTNSTQVEKERLQAEALLNTSNEALEQAKAFTAGFEPRIRELVPQLPLPLQELLKPLLNRLPAEPAQTKMMATERIQVVIGILNELDKFNSAVSVFSEKRQNGKGEEVAVETVYVGLGAAYFVNDLSDFAGVGRPGPTGWEWNPKQEIASSVREVIRIYRNERPARFVALPAVIH
ncbi:MAG: DUF3450 family protein [Verrucomicrobiota bacterium]